MALTKRGTFSKNYANTMSGSSVTVKCFACKKSVTFDPVTDDTPYTCPHCGRKGMRTCIGDTCVCESFEPPKAD